jgi:hypothetical protein
MQAFHDVTINSMVDPISMKKMYMVSQVGSMDIYGLCGISWTFSTLLANRAVSLPVFQSLLKF